MSFIKNISVISTQHPDVKLWGADGELAVHTLLLVVHSQFLKEILMSVPDFSETTIIIPDYTVQELKTLTSVMYGLNKTVLVSENILKTLGVFEFDKAKLEYHDGLLVIYGGPLEGFRLIDPAKKFYLPLPSTEPTRETSPHFSIPVQVSKFSPEVEQYIPPQFPSSRDTELADKFFITSPSYTLYSSNTIVVNDS